MKKSRSKSHKKKESKNNLNSELTAQILSLINQTINQQSNCSDNECCNTNQYELEKTKIKNQLQDNKCTCCIYKLKLLQKVLEKCHNKCPCSNNK